MERQGSLLSKSVGGSKMEKNEGTKNAITLDQLHIRYGYYYFMAFNKVESGGMLANSQCHKFLQYSKEKVPCTIKPGKRFRWKI